MKPWKPQSEAARQIVKQLAKGPATTIELANKVMISTTRVNRIVKHATNRGLVTAKLLNNTGFQNGGRVNEWRLVDGALDYIVLSKEEPDEPVYETYEKAEVLSNKINATWWAQGKTANARPVKVPDVEPPYCYRIESLVDKLLMGAS